MTASETTFSNFHRFKFNFGDSLSKFNYIVFVLFSVVSFIVQF